MTGTREYSDAASAEPATGCRMAMMSAYPLTTRMVSLRDSPLETEELAGLSNPMIRPPSRSIAVWKDICVRVDGS